MRNDMLRCFVKVLILFEVTLCAAFIKSFHNRYYHRSIRYEQDRVINIKPVSGRHSIPIITHAFPYADIVLTEPNDVDVHQLASLLKNISSHLGSDQPAESILEIQRQINFCYSRDIPRLASKLLQDFPEHRDDEKIMHAYSFLIDVLEISTNQLLSMAKQYQKLLNEILSSAKLGEVKLNETLTALSSLVSSAEFLAYIESEIENQVSGSPAHSLLVTVKLAVLESYINCHNKDKYLSIIPKIASIENNVHRRALLLEEFRLIEDTAQQANFIKSLRELIDKIQHHDSVDETLVSRMTEMEQVCSSILALNNSFGVEENDVEH